MRINKKPKLNITMISALLKELRIKEKLSLKQLSEKTGYSIAIISKLENDINALKIPIPLVIVMTILDALDYDLLVRKRKTAK